ncbi:MAG: type II toxin-antitoxin system YafQ family toxin, partial [Lachnospiraceae bacterium]|nr:type II toxin-antitoxin system YafQ family toxin [Lachnospiraceae bacterium]
MTTKYSIERAARFKRQYAHVMSQNKNMQLIDVIIAKLACGIPLEPVNKDHALKGEWAGYRECHIEPDWLLIYR